MEPFIQKLTEKHKLTAIVPSTEEISTWANQLMSLLFPEMSGQRYVTTEEIKNKLEESASELRNILCRTMEGVPAKCEEIVASFMHDLPDMYDNMLLDLDAFVQGDPAARSSYEVVRTYPGFTGVFMYRLAHLLYQSEVPLIPRILGEFAHSKTGIDIHPGAKIGKSFFIDHGTGVVIGETAVIGDHVKIYQGVTLGALSVEKAMAGVKRHPTVGDHTVIYSGATILGGDTVIGKDCIIGGNVWLTTSVPDGIKVYHNADNKFIKKLNKSHNEENH
jgi:serine O-acetyltransferase